MEKEKTGGMRKARADERNGDSLEEKRCGEVSREVEES